MMFFALPVERPSALRICLLFLCGAVLEIGHHYIAVSVSPALNEKHFCPYFGLCFGFLFFASSSLFVAKLF